MDSILIILPDFLIILLGAWLAQKTVFPRSFWQSAEKLVFYVLFPPLLFTSIASSNISVSQASYFLVTAIGAMLLAVVSSWMIRFCVKTSRLTRASVFQCGFRFNTYIGFAICLKLFGQDGFALMALIIAFWVPISNTIAVSVLAQAVAAETAEKESNQSNNWTKTALAVIKNPLIIATVLGLVFNIGKIPLPEVGTSLLKHLGSASLTMGLLCIGAGLKISAIKKEFTLLLACSVQRLLVVPLVAWGVAALAGLGALETGVLVLFAALPTAQSCYVMTASMGGDATAVANVTTAQTLCSMVTLWFWLTVLLTGLSQTL